MPHLQPQRPHPELHPLRTHARRPGRRLGRARRAPHPELAERREPERTARSVRSAGGQRRRGALRGRVHGGSEGEGWREGEVSAGVGGEGEFREGMSLSDVVG